MAVCSPLAEPSEPRADSELFQSNRYRHLIDDVHFRSWLATFKMFDRDGGGDVDLKELGVVFRQLGMTPSQDEMERMIYEV
jgi:Ca2+-binding EF-hand superfamily protein